LRRLPESLRSDIVIQIKAFLAGDLIADP